MTRPVNIGAAAQSVGCCPETLRNYVRRGRLPDRRDSTNRRIFTPADLRRARQLWENARG